MFTPFLVIVMVASLVIALPVVSVQAASPHVTYFTGTATVVAATPGTVKTVGRCELMTGSVIHAIYACDDPRFTGTITNILTSLTKPNGKSTMWSTSSSFAIDGGGTITGKIWGQGIMPTVLTGHYIGYGDGFKVIMQFNGDYAVVAVSGKIIET